MENELRQLAKPFIENALRNYAGFFAEVSEGTEQSASEKLANIREIDCQAKKALDSDALQYYQERRTRLMRLFRERLVKDLRGQVQIEVLERAQELVNRFGISIEPVQDQELISG